MIKKIFKLKKVQKKAIDFFDSKFYLDTYIDVKNANIDPLEHYIKYGWKEARLPYSNFDINLYDNVENFEDLLQKMENNIVLQKKLKNKEKLKYQKDVNKLLKSELFLAEWVERKYPDLKGQDSILHFCIFGHKENRNPNPFFDTQWYKSQYSDIGEENPLIHYITVGWKKGYNPSPKFNVKKYLEMYPEVKKEKIEPLKHFLTIGREKGYDYFPTTDATSLKINNESSIVKKLFKNVSTLYDYPFNNLNTSNSTFFENNLKISFVIPDYGIGGGGHMTIFRMIRFLEWFGHDVTIWIFNPSRHDKETIAYDDIIKHYQVIKAEVKLIDNYFSNEAKGDVIFATGWDTVSPVMSVTDFKRRFYLVQDYEPSFFAQGTYSELAKLTYGYDIDTICASTWLEEVMQTKHSRWAKSFDLAADKEIFYPPLSKTENNIPKIAFYARHFTPRRGVEIGMVALEMLAKEGVKFHVDFYGADLNITEAPFSATDHGVKSPEELAEIYRHCDIGVVFSLTNYSLVPQEMMQCGLPIVEFDTESTRAIYPDDVVTFAGPDARDIARKIKELLLNKEKQKIQSQKANKWVSQFSWEKSARKIENSLITRLKELGFDSQQKKTDEKIKCSVVIPTYNGGDVFKTVLAKVLEQKTPWKFEVIVLDSQSGDGTYEYVEKLNNNLITLKTIKKEEFNHGETRNYGASIAQGEYVAFITQDAIPYDTFWLYNLVTPLEHYREAAGAFGKHIAHDGAKFFTIKEMDEHFHAFSKLPLCVSRDLDQEKYKNDISWRQKLHFYSDNNSCFRKSVWEKIPFRKVKYGEDQLWANDIIEAGYGKVYACKSIVKHSHEYTPEETYERAKIDGDYFKYFWNYKMIDENNLKKILSDFEEHDKMLALENGIPVKDFEYRMETLKARFQGYVDGYYKNPSLFDENNNEKSKF